MEQLRNSLLLLLLSSPLSLGASTSSSSSHYSAPGGSSTVEDEIVTSTFDGTAGHGHVTQTQTFVPTTYSQFTTERSTISTNTVIEIPHGTSTTFITYSYLIGPGGVGWEIPTSFSDDAPFFPQPTFLPGHKPSGSKVDTQTSTHTGSETGSHGGSQTSTETATHTNTGDGSHTGTETGTQTGSRTESDTGSHIGTQTNTHTSNQTDSVTGSHTGSHTGSETGGSHSHSETGTQTDSHTSSETDSQSGSHTSSETGSHTGSETGTHTGSETGAHTGSHTGSETGTDTGSHTGSETGTHTNSETGSYTGSETGTDIGSHTGSETGTHTDSETGSQTGSHTGSETGTHTGSYTGSETGTHTGSHTGSETGTHTDSETGTHTSSETGTHTGSHTDSETGTYTNSETGTHTGSHTGSETDSHTNSDTNSHTGTGTSTHTSSETSTHTSTHSDNTSKSSGSTATDDPSSTSTTQTPTATITSAPTGFSASTLSGTSISDNTWITTKDDEGHTTIVPVIITGGKPVIMWNVPDTPNVEFKFPNLPSFNLPCIKVFGVSVGSCSSPPSGGDSGSHPTGKPTDKPTDKPTETKTDKTTEKTTEKTTTASETSTSSDECTATHTVSNCEVKCAKLTTSNSCVSSTTTCSHTQTGCSVTGTTTTVSTSTSACTSCSSCLATPPAYLGDIESLSDDDDNSAQRRHARDLRGPDLRARDSAIPLEKFGNCALETGPSKLTIPAWPMVTNDIVNPEKDNNLGEKYKTVPRYDQATRTVPDGHCAVPTIIRETDVQAFLARTSYKNMQGKEQKRNNDATMDHAYEKSWLEEFFTSLVDSNTKDSKISCSDLNDLFFPKLVDQPCKKNLLEPVWNGLASNDNLDFVILSQYLNGNAKGKLFAQAGKTISTKYVDDDRFVVGGGKGYWGWGKGKFQNAEKVLWELLVKGFEPALLGCLEMKKEPMLDLIDKTNNRIYGKLLTLDNQLRDPANHNVDIKDELRDAWKSSFGSDGIAGAYKKYMNDYTEPQINVPSQFLTKLWKRIKDNIDKAKSLDNVGSDPNNPDSKGQHYEEWESFKKTADSVDKVYSKGDSYDWDYSFSFSWNAHAAKRDEGKLTCGGATTSLTSTKTSATSSSSTGTHTSKETTSNSETTKHSTTSSESSSSDRSSSETTKTKTNTDTTGTVTSTSDHSSHTSTGSHGGGTKTSHTDKTSTESSTKTTSSTKTSSSTSAGVTAPAVTVGKSDMKVDECSQGYGTYSAMAKATAPASADSQKFYAAVADQYISLDWEVNFMDGYIGNKEDISKKNLTDPKTVIESWTVKTNADNKPIAEGKGGKDMKIKWKNPEKANGTVIELNYKEGLEKQEWGFIVQGGKSACMPKSCSGPPTTVKDDNGMVCKKWPCSTAIDCNDSGEVTPHAECLVIEDGIIFPLWYDVSIVVNNFVHDDGEKLKSEEKGCGAMMDWGYDNIKVESPDHKWTATQEFHFTLPITIASGCVERAIASAGGPKNLQCENGASDWVFRKKRGIGFFERALNRMKRGLTLPGRAWEA